MRGRRRVAVAAAAVALAAAIAISVVPSWTASPTSLPPGSTAPSTVPGATVYKGASPTNEGATPTTLMPAPSALFADPGGTVYEMDRLSVESGWVFEYVQGLPPQIMFTDDAGATWRDATPPGLTETPTIDFLDPQHGWVLEMGAFDQTTSAAIPASLWRTSDGGRHWTLATLPRQDISAATISFIVPTAGYLAVTPNAEPNSRQTILYATADGGSSWTKVGVVADEQLDSEWSHQLFFLSKSDGFFVNDGSVSETHDDGRTWKPVSFARPAEIPASAYVNVLDFVVAGSDVLASAEYGWKTGDSLAFASGYEFISHDRGETWSLAWSGVPGLDSRSKVVAVDETTLLRFRDYRGSIPDTYTTAFTVTHDGGLTWTSVSAALPSDTHFYAESFANALDGWAVVAVNVYCPDGALCPGPSPGGRLVETSDGGVTWRLGSTR